MANLYNEIDFSQKIEEDAEWERFLKEAAKSIAKEDSEQLRRIKKPVFDEQLQNHLIITGIPQLTEAKEKNFYDAFTEGNEKKKGLLKVKNLLDGLVEIECGYKLVDNVKNYNKTIHLIYKTAAQAKKAYHKLNNFKFDKNHTLYCFTIKEFQDVEKIKDIYQEPTFIDRSELHSYNLHQNHIDQFIFRDKRIDGSSIYLNWFDYIEKNPEEALPRIQISPNANLVWSPKGSYLAICEPNGVILRGGKNLQLKGFYEHKGVINVGFSPDETFLVTFNGNDVEAKSTENLILWGIQSEIKIRSFRAQPHQDVNSFQWNTDESKLAFVGNNQLYFYHSRNVNQLKQDLLLSEEELIDKKKLINIPNLQKIAWMPNSSMILCVCYELDPAHNSHPTSKIFFYNSETHEEKKWKAIGQHIKKAEIVIAKNSQWVSVSYKRFQKKNQSTTTIQIVDLTKKQIETEIVEFKENVGNISWDRKFNRFAVTCQDPTTIKSVHIKYNIHFYQIQSKDRIQKANQIAQINATSANRVILPENGQYFALYNISPNSSGRGKFSMGYLSKDQKNKKSKLQFVKENVDIAYMNFFTIDQSGRFILLGTEKSYQIWSFAGEMLFKDIFTEPISNVFFRPRYLNQLPPEQEKQMQKEEKKIRDKYEELDKQKLNAIQYQREQEKKKKRGEFKEYMQKKKSWFKQFQTQREKIVGFNEKQSKTEQYVHYIRQRN